MKHISPGIIALTLVILFSEGEGTVQLEPFGLEAKRVTALSLSSRQFHPGGNFLCAGTYSNGIYLKEMNSPDSQWVNYGLEDKLLLSVYVYHWGEGPADWNTIFVGVHPNTSSGDTISLFRYTYGFDTTWVSIDTRHDLGYVRTILAIGGFFYSGHEPSQPIFIGAGGATFRSYSWESWEEVLSMGINVIQIYQNWHNGLPGTIWAGGVLDAFAPYLAKSLDQGETWEIFYPDLGGDNTCHSIAIDPKHPDTVYAGMQGAVIKTTDGGKTWIITSLQGVPVIFWGLAIDPVNPYHLVAGGKNIETGFALYESYDAGDNWDQIVPDTEISGISSLVAQTSDDEFIAYIGTFGDGVFRYRSEITAVTRAETEETPKDFTLYQNYPNPFNASTTIEYYLPSSGWTSLKVYNAMGQEVTALVDNYQTNGHHSIAWDASDIESGIYFYQLKCDDKLQQMKKLVLLK